jgi:uncharacterized protein YqjF (DUF2071 family)
MESFSVFPPRSVPQPVMFQEWCNLTFLHWRCDAQVLQRLLPGGLEIEVFDGSAWLGMTPFLLSGLHPPGVPALPWLSQFPETNVRTYVRGPDGESGIWFLTLETSRLMAAVGGRFAYGLPYRWARMHVAKSSGGMSYRSARGTEAGTVGTHVVVSIHEPIKQPNELERFLTARFRLYAIHHGKIVFADVEHEPWPLCHAGIWHMQENLTASLGVAVVDEPLVHYSSGVHTRIGRPIRYDAAAEPRPCPTFSRSSLFKKAGIYGHAHAVTYY